jgi:hypothetical protein
MPDDKYPATSAARKIDPEVVERAKIMKDAGYSLRSIAKACGRSVATIQRYLKMPDAEELALQEGDKERAQEIRKYRKAAWRIIHLANEQVEKALMAGDIKGKDAAVVAGIYFDKLAAGARVSEKPLGQIVNFNFFSSDGDGNTSDRPIPHTIDVPSVSVAVQGDDMRPGRGEDLLGLPGGCENVSGEPRDSGCGGGIDVPQHEGLRPADDNGGTVAGAGDS